LEQKIQRQLENRIYKLKNEIIKVFQKWQTNIMTSFWGSDFDGLIIKSSSGIPQELEDKLIAMVPVEELNEVIRESFNQGIKIETINHSVKFDDGLIDWTLYDKRTSKFLDNYTFKASQKTLDRINGGNILGLIKDQNEKGGDINDMIHSIHKSFQEFSDYEAERIARTETLRARNFARFMSLKEDFNVDKKTWQTHIDGRQRKSHEKLHLETVPIDEPFPNGLMFPGDPSGIPSEVINCRCSLLSGQSPDKIKRKTDDEDYEIEDPMESIKEDLPQHYIDYSLKYMERLARKLEKEMIDNEEINNLLNQNMSIMAKQAEETMREMEVDLSGNVFVLDTRNSYENIVFGNIKNVNRELSLVSEITPEIILAESKNITIPEYFKIPEEGYKYYPLVSQKEILREVSRLPQGPKRYRIKQTGFKIPNKTIIVDDVIYTAYDSEIEDIIYSATEIFVKQEQEHLPGLTVQDVIDTFFDGDNRFEFDIVTPEEKRQFLKQYCYKNKMLAGSVNFEIDLKDIENTFGGVEEILNLPNDDFREIFFKSFSPKFDLDVSVEDSFSNKTIKKISNMIDWVEGYIFGSVLTAPIIIHYVKEESYYDLINNIIYLNDESDEEDILRYIGFYIQNTNSGIFKELSQSDFMARILPKLLSGKSIKELYKNDKESFEKIFSIVRGSF